MPARMHASVCASTTSRPKLQVAEVTGGLEGARSVIAPVGDVAQRLHRVDDLRLRAELRRRLLSVNPNVFGRDLSQGSNLLAFGMRKDSRTDARSARHPERGGSG